MKRYQSSVTVGHITTTIDFADIADAQRMQARYRSRERRNRDAFGGIYDREASAYVTDASWRGGIRLSKLPTIADVYAKLIARGEPVSVIGERGVAHFNSQNVEAR